MRGLKNENYKKKRKKKEEERKKQETSTDYRSPTQRHRFITTIKSVMNIDIYTHTHKQNQNSPTRIKYNRLTRRTKETKNYIYPLKTKLTKAQTGDRTKARCQLENKVVKMKLTNTLPGKERKKRKNRYTK